MTTTVTIGEDEFELVCAQTRQGKTFGIYLPPAMAETARKEGAFTFVPCEFPPEEDPAEE